MNGFQTPSVIVILLAAVASAKSNFRPQIFGCVDGQPWQANQAMQAFIPCSTLAEAEDLLDRLENSNIESYLKSLSVAAQTFFCKFVEHQTEGWVSA